MNDRPKQLPWLSPPIAVAMIIILALMVRLIVLWQVSSDPGIDHLGGDGAAYWRWSQTIAGGSWIGNEVFYQTPLYPYFLAVLQKLSGVGESGVRVVQACLGAAGCGILALGTWRLTSRSAGLIAGAMLALYPPAISFDLQIDKPVLDIFLVCTLIWCIAWMQDGSGIWRFVVSGLICGLLALNRENALVLLAILPVWISRKQRDRDRRLRIRAIIALVVGAMAAILPVAIRNSVIGHEPFLTTAQFGPNFYIGNNAGADGVYRALRGERGDAIYERADATELAEQAERHSLTPGEVSRYWTRQTLAEIRAHPARWSGLMIRKLAMVFASTELADSDVHDRLVCWSPVLDALDSFYGFGAILVLAAAGLLITDHRDRLVVLAGMSVALAVATSLFFIFGRYRIGLTLMLIPLAAEALARIPEIARQRRFRHAGFAVLAACAATALVVLGERSIPQRIRGTNFYNRAKINEARGRIEEAEALYRRTIAANPTLGAAYNNLGLLLVNRNEVRQAIPLLAEATRLEPNDVPARINFGMALARSGKMSEALDQFRTAVQLDPASSAAKYNLAAALLMQGDRSAATRILAPLAASDSTDPFAQRAALLLRSLPPATTQSTGG